MLPKISLLSFITLMLSSAAAGYDLKPSKVNLSEGLAPMNSLVELTILPTSPLLANDGDFGISLARLADLKSQWVDKKIFDWNEAQATLNS